MKTKLIQFILVALVAFAFGRWAAPTKVITETKTVEVEKSKETKSVDKDVHKVTKVKTKKNKDGSEETETVTEEDTSTKSDAKKSASDVSSSENREEKTYGSPRTFVGVSSKLNLSGPQYVSYGAIVVRPIIGPITIGVFGFMDGTVGGSVGLTF
jgi:hypothetical protein